MPRYRANSLLFVDGARIRAGQEFSSNSPPNDQWIPLDTGATKAVAAKAAPEPAPAGPVDPFAGWSKSQLQDFIETKSRNKKRPPDDWSEEKLLETAQRLAKPEVD